MRCEDRLSLPDPDPATLERVAAVTAALDAAIARAPDGVIGFDAFMEIALYLPESGYYAAGRDIFGPSGDFVTAPESGELFGACVATQCAEILAHAGPDVIEYGAGSGELALQLGRRLLADDDARRYRIVEPSAGLRARQQARIAADPALEAARFHWSASHPAIACAGVVIANEVIDAMPARRYRVTGGVVEELGVARGDHGFVWRTLRERPVPASLAQALRDHPEGYTCERHAGLAAWLRAVRRVLRRGVVLIVDYGYTAQEYLHPARSDGTLKCHYRHHVHDDAFHLPGAQDLTVAVDFSALAEAACAAGFRVAGFTTQTRFLLACGIERLLATCAGSTAARYSLAQEAKRLLLPGEMGQTCKFMALAVDYDHALAGFVDDERHRLDGYAR